MYLLAPSFPKVISDGRYLDVDSELRREAGGFRGGSWVSNVSRSEMFKGIVGSTFLGWDQHGLWCLLFGRLFKALRVPIPVLRTTPNIAWESTVFGVAGSVTHFEARKVVQWVLAHWLVLSCIHSLESRRLANPPRVSPLHV